MQKPSILFFMVKGLAWVTLWPLSLILGFVVSVRNWLYDFKILKVKKLPYPVISIGNISVGGSGKTPLVMLLLKNLNNENITILTRGYGSEVAKIKDYPQVVKDGLHPSLYGDEPSLIVSKFPKNTVVLDGDRFRGGEWILKQEDDFTEAFILDDGFQHRKLHRDLDLVVFDVEQYVRAPGLLPFGRFRESVNNLSRADAIVFSKWQNLPEQKVNEVEEKIKNKFENTPLFYFQHKIGNVKNKKENELKMNFDGKVILFSALGSPVSFENDLKRSFVQMQIVQHKVFPDHYNYTEDDIKDLVSLAEKEEAKLICTEKDYIKIQSFTDVKNIYVTAQDSYLSEDFYTFIRSKIFMEKEAHDKVLD